MIKAPVYFGHISIGEVELWPKGATDLAAAPWVREIRVDRLSPASERCPPLAVLQTVSPSGRCLVMESRPTATTADEPPSPLVSMHTACLRDNKVYMNHHSQQLEKTEQSEQGILVYRMKYLLAHLLH
jgi:RNA polymerase II C-terminal domain phosphatase-like 1/2